MEHSVETWIRDFLDVYSEGVYSEGVDSEVVDSEVVDSEVVDSGGNDIDKTSLLYIVNLVRLEIRKLIVVWYHFLKNERFVDVVGDNSHRILERISTEWTISESTEDYLLLQEYLENKYINNIDIQWAIYDYFRGQIDPLFEKIFSKIHMSSSWKFEIKEWETFGIGDDLSWTENQILVYLIENSMLSANEKEDILDVLKIEWKSFEDYRAEFYNQDLLQTYVQRLTKTDKQID